MPVSTAYRARSEHSAAACANASAVSRASISRAHCATSAHAVAASSSLAGTSGTPPRMRLSVRSSTRTSVGTVLSRSRAVLISRAPGENSSERFTDGVLAHSSTSLTSRQRSTPPAASCSFSTPTRSIVSPGPRTMAGGITHSRR